MRVRNAGMIDRDDLLDMAVDDALDLCEELGVSLEDLIQQR